MPVPRSSPRIATIYRGLHNVERVRLDFPGVTELSTAELTVNPLTGEPGLQRGFPSSSFGATEDQAQTLIGLGRSMP